MSRKLQENVVAIVLLATFIALFVVSLGYGPRARLVPLPIAGLAVVLLIAQLFWQNYRPADDLKLDMMEVVGADRKIAAVEDKLAPILATAPDVPSAPAEPSLRQEASAYGIVLALVGLFLVLGPVPAVFVYTTGYLGLSKQKTWPRAALFGFVCAAFLYLTFGYVLGLQLNHGLLAPYSGKYVHF